MGKYKIEIIRFKSTAISHVKQSNLAQKYMFKVINKKKLDTCIECCDKFVQGQPRAIQNDIHKDVSIVYQLTLRKFNTALNTHTHTHTHIYIYIYINFISNF